jgi:hypothetical protein
MPNLQPNLRRLLDIIASIYSYTINEWRRSHERSIGVQFEDAQPRLRARMLVFDFTQIACPEATLEMMGKYYTLLTNYKKSTRFEPRQMVSLKW